MKANMFAPASFPAVAETPPSEADRITLLKAPGIACKTVKKATLAIGPDGKPQKDAGAGSSAFHVIVRPVTSLAELFGAMGPALRVQKLCFGMGAPAEGANKASTPWTSTVAVDAPRRWFPLDFDAQRAPGLGEPDQMRNAGKHFRALLGPEFEGASAIVAATSASGRLGPDHCSFRLIFWTRAPLTLAQQKAVVHALNKRMADAGVRLCLDESIYAPGRLLYTARPVFAAGLSDPLPEDQRIALLDGDTTVVLGDDLMRATISAGGGVKAPAARRASADEEDYKGRILPVPEDQRETALIGLVETIPNTVERFGDRNAFVGVAHAIKGAAGGSPWGRDLFLRWADTWDGPSDADENARIYDTLRGGENGLQHLLALSLACDPAGAKASARKPIWDALFPELAPEQLAALQPMPPNPIIAEMNKRYAFIQSRPDGVMDRAGTALEPMRMLSLSSFHNIHANRHVPEGEGRKGRTVSQFWFSHPERAEYADADLYEVGDEPPNCLNLWPGLAVEGEPGGWGTINGFLVNVICDGDKKAFDYLLNLLRWKIQNPTKNPQVGIVLQGAPGTGKGTFWEMLKTIFGPRFVQHFGRSDDATARFNTLEEGRVVLFFDETFFGHDKKAAGRLKTAITEDYITIEPKGLHAYTVRNVALRVFASNERAALPVDPDDRRLLVLGVSTARQNDMAYFSGLRAAFAGDELRAFVHDALLADLSAFEAERRLPVRTEARAAMAAITEEPEDAYVRHVIANGGAPDWNIWPDMQSAAAQNNPWENGPVLVSRNAVYASYVAFMREQFKNKHVRRPQDLHAAFKRALGDCIMAKDTTRGSAQSKERVFWFAPLPDCRARYEAFSGGVAEE